MDNVILSVKEKIKNNRSTFLYCLLITFIIGMVTHGYMYFQDSFSHDSLFEFNGNERIEWRIQLGRFLVPLCRMLTRGHLTLPWLIGVYSLLWISLAVFLTVKLFNVKSKLFTALISGIYTANITVIATTATYIHDLDADMLAMLMSVLAVFMFCKYKRGYILSAICAFGALGLYQCYISVAITLMIIYLILELLKGKEFKSVFLSGLKFVIVLAVAGILYFAASKAIMFFGNIAEVSKYNTMDGMASLGVMDIIFNLVDTYRNTIYWFIFPQKTLTPLWITGISAVLLGISGYIVAFKIFSKGIGAKEKVLTIMLIALFPLAMNISLVLIEWSHDLMYFSTWLVYLFALLLIYRIKDFGINSSGKISKIAKYICILIVIAILHNNIVLANEFYLKKDLEQEAALSYYTRVLNQMDSFDGYDRETTPVVFAGKPDIFTENMAGFENADRVIGISSNDVLGSYTNPKMYKKYFEYKLHYGIIAEENYEEYFEKDIVRNMPIFPEEGSLQMVDGTLVVKLGEIVNED